MSEQYDSKNVYTSNWVACVLLAPLLATAALTAAHLFSLWLRQRATKHSVLESCSHLLMHWKGHGPSNTLKCTAEYQLEEIRRIGHRGNGHNTKMNHTPRENTIESFLVAYSKGAQMVEMDVQLTSDKQLVVFHDHAICRRLIADMTYREFLVESCSTEDSFRSTNTTLENILEALPEDLALYLEMKYEADVKSYPPNYRDEVVKHTLELIKRYPEKKILFASFSPYVCALLKTQYPQYKVCFLMCDSTLHYVPKERLADAVEKFVEDFEIDGVVCDTEFYAEAEKLLQKLEGKVKFLYGSGTNSMESLQRFTSLGFTGFCTDNLDIHGQL